MNCYEFMTRGWKSPRSGRRHRAWGGAQRNPRTVVENIRSPRSGRQSNYHVRCFRSRDLYRLLRRLCGFLCWRSWGFAALHPRLYADTRSAGWTTLSL